MLTLRNLPSVPQPGRDLLAAFKWSDASQARCGRQGGKGPENQSAPGLSTMFVHDLPILDPFTRANVNTFQLTPKGSWRAVNFVVGPGPLSLRRFSIERGFPQVI